MQQEKAPCVSLPWLLSKKPRVLCRCSSRAWHLSLTDWLTCLLAQHPGTVSPLADRPVGGWHLPEEPSSSKKEHISKEPSGLAAVSGPLSTQSQRPQGFITNGPVRPAASFSALYLIQPWQCSQGRSQACSSQCHR